MQKVKNEHGSSGRQPGGPQQPRLRTHHLRLLGVQILCGCVSRTGPDSHLESQHQVGWGAASNLSIEMVGRGSDMGWQSRPGVPHRLLSSKRTLSCFAWSDGGMSSSYSLGGGAGAWLRVLRP